MQDFESDLSSLSAKRNPDRRQMLATSLAVGFAAAVQPVVRADGDHDRHRGPDRRRGQDPRRRTARSPPTGRCRPRAGRSRSSSSSRRSSACTSTSRTSAAGSPSSATSPSRPSCTRARATSPKIERHPGDHLQGRLQGAGRAGHVRPRRDRRLGQERRARPTPRSSASPASAGAGGSCGSTAAHNPNSEGGRRLVRPARRRAGRAAPEAPHRRRRRPQGPGARPLRRRRQGHPGRHVEKMRRRCKAAGKPCEIVVYPDTPHAFNADYRPSYREGRGRRTAGRACWPGSARTVSPKTQLEQHLLQERCHHGGRG